MTVSPVPSTNMGSLSLFLVDCNSGASVDCMRSSAVVWIFSAIPTCSFKACFSRVLSRRNVACSQAVHFEILFLAPSAVSPVNILYVGIIFSLSLSIISVRFSSGLVCADFKQTVSFRMGSSLEVFSIGAFLTARRVRVSTVSATRLPHAFMACSKFISTLSLSRRDFTTYCRCGPQDFLCHTKW